MKLKKKIHLNINIDPKAKKNHLNNWNKDWNRKNYNAGLIPRMNLIISTQTKIMQCIIIPIKKKKQEQSKKK